MFAIPVPAPDTFHGLPISTVNVIIGALIALLPLTASLLYDAHQKRKQHRLAARREVFLNAAEGAAAVREYIVSYVGGRSRTDWKGTWQTAPGWLEKIAIIGTEDTIRAFGETGAAADRAVTELELLQGQIDDKDLEARMMVDWRESIKRAQTFIGEHPALPVPQDWKDDPRIVLMNRMMESFDRERKIGQEIIVLHGDLARLCLRHAQAYTKQLYLAIGHVRRELDFPPLDALLAEIAGSGEQETAKYLESIISRRGPFADDEAEENDAQPPTLPSAE